MYRRRPAIGRLKKAREPHAVAARDFTRNFGRYKMEAQHQAVPVSSHGSVIGYFVQRARI